MEGDDSALVVDVVEVEPDPQSKAVKRVADAAFDQIAEAIADFAEWAKSPDTKVTRGLIAARLDDLRTTVSSAFDVLAEDMKREIGDLITDAEEAEAEKQQDAVDELEELEGRYETAIRILWEDAKIDEDAIDEASRHASPVSFLKQQRDRRS